MRIYARLRIYRRIEDSGFGDELAVAIMGQYKHAVLRGKEEDLRDLFRLRSGFIATNLG